MGGHKHSTIATCAQSRKKTSCKAWKLDRWTPRYCLTKSEQSHEKPLHLCIHKLLLWISSSQKLFYKKKLQISKIGPTDAEILFECWWCAQFNVVQCGRYPPIFLFHKVHPHHQKIGNLVKKCKPNGWYCSIVQTNGLFCKRHFTWWQVQ